MIEDTNQEARVDTRPLAIVFSDDDDARRRNETAISLAGGRLGGSLGIGAMRQRLEDQASARLILIDFLNTDPLEIGPAIRRVERFAEEVAGSALLSAPLEMLDMVLAQVESPRVSIMCDPDQSERICSLAQAWQTEPMALADSATDLDSLRLKRLADEVNRIARALNNLSSAGEMAPQTDRISRPVSFSPSGRVRDVQLGFAAEPQDLAPPSAGELRSILRLRRLRESFFDSELFADPSWDMLLDLMAARQEGDQVAVSSLCIAAAVPPTTALRWIKTMTDAGLFERHADPMDGRRIFIRLSDKAADALTRYFAAARRYEDRPI